jgi:bis(5'-nucleosyl)-tetraphosphatase (symmetrical)
MARYAVGDIQGCFVEFQLLLEKIHFDPRHDQLFSVGDIVNRGPESLAVLRWMYQHRHAIHMVLGNHDLHLLAVAAGSAKQKSGDTLEQILIADDRYTLLTWLRHQPLFSVFDGFCLVHAGVWPGWHLDEVKAFTQEVERALQGSDYQAFFQTLYGDEPKAWSSTLQGADRLRFIVNSMTRMRALYPDKSLDFLYTGTLTAMPQPLQPWFAFAQQPDIPRIISGHWSALSLYLTPQVWCLDTACVWGRQLTMVNCDTGEVFQQPACD